MKSASLRRVAIGTLLFLFWTALPGWGQSIPADFALIGTAGGLEPNSENATVRISANGQATYDLFVPGDPAAPFITSTSFTLTTAELEQLWQAIQANGFFNLPSDHVNEDIEDRTFAEIIVVANGTSHRVTTQNIALEAFDTVVATINGLTPDSNDLVYDTTESPAFAPRDICDQPGKREQIQLSKGDKGDVQTVAGAGNDGAAASGLSLNGGAHPGTAAAYRMTLREAVDRGIVSLSGKGEFYGDAVSISIDNSSRATSSRLDVSLYLEFWGPAASTSTAQVAENAIERIWGEKTTTDGKDLSVEVHKRVSPGGSAPPSTAGYHQIKLVESGTSGVKGRGKTFDVNTGVGSGTWRTTGKLLDEMYAHEAGHLLGLPDRYIDYRKQEDGKWKDQDGNPFTTDELAAKLDPTYPNLTEAQLKEFLNKVTRITPPKPGSENDIMGNKTRNPIQGDIDRLAAQAGLIIEIRPGDILVNKNGIAQNYVITRSEDVFVPPGGSKTLDGLYAACIDRWKDTPAEGAVFDVAPSLSEWNGIESAHVLQQLLDFTNEHERFCDGDLPAQWATWRITDNHLIGDVDAEAYLQEVGLELGRRLLDFPRMANPAPFVQGTQSLVPAELFVPEIEISPRDIVRSGETILLAASIVAPSLQGVSTTFSWSLERPDGSSAVLSSRQGGTTSFTPDARGLYSVQLQAVLTGGVSGSRTRTASAAVATFDTRTETFEPDLRSQDRSFQWGTTPADPWIVTDEDSNTGETSAASAAIEDGGVTGLQATFEQASAGPLSFSYRVSSEPDFDLLWFFVDEQVQGSWSGEVDWSVFTLDLPAGAHTATWIYSKDGSDSEGADRVWVDDVFFSVDAVFTSVEETLADDVPVTYQLRQNYPNPFNPATTIGYSIAEPQHVHLVVFDALGRQIAVLVDMEQDAGQYKVRFDASDLSTGMYHYELRAGVFRKRKSMILLR